MAQKAELVDVTPAGYDFSQYAAGTTFAVQASNNDAWSPTVGMYDQDIMDANKHFTVYLRRGVANENTDDYIANSCDAQNIKVQDFGGYLGKALVINQAWAPLCTANLHAQSADWVGYNPWGSVKTGGAHTWGLCFFGDPNTLAVGAENPVRVRIVFNYIRRGRHAFNDGAETKVVIPSAFAMEENDETGNPYRPRLEDLDNVGTLNLTGFDFCKWAGEGTSLAEMPATHAAYAIENQNEDPFDTNGTASAAYATQNDRYMVLEFDTYREDAGNTIKAQINWLNANASMIIKEVKFYNITNYAEIAGSPEDLTSGSRIRYKYYTEKGIDEPEMGDLPTEPDPIDPDPVDNGDGSEANPFKLYTAADVVGLANKVIAYDDYEDCYISLQNDIDMTGVEMPCPIYGGGGNYDKFIHFEGNKHVISNLTMTKNEHFSYPSLFGVLNGSVQNLGLVDFNYSTGGDGAGALGAYGAQQIETTVDNVYAVGTINGGGASYVGGLFGTNGTDLNITNSYARVNVANDDAGRVGGIVGRPNGKTTVSNVYYAGDLNGATVGGIYGQTTKSPTLTINNAVVLEGAITGTTVNAFTNSDATMTGTVVSDAVTLNGNKADGAVALTAAQQAVCGWAAYRSDALFDSKYPMLSWETKASGVTPVVFDNDSDAAPVYYNLQGVRVANPENGLYIVVRGSKVTKEVIR